jgi:ankyrin repeat protein
MTPVFWTAVVFDVILFAVLLVFTLTGSGHSDGGREMALFFSILLPAVVIGGGMLLFLRSASTTKRIVALIVVAGPGILLAATRLQSAAIDYRVRRNSEAEADSNAAALDVIRELVTLGADPNGGLKTATKIRDGRVLQVLLAAGAKPGYSDDRGPVSFEWLGVMPLANFTALLDHGLDLDIVDSSRNPLIMTAARGDRWDFVLLLMARGADPLLGDREGMTLADVVQRRLVSTMERPAEMKADIVRVKAQLSTLKSARVAK